MKNKPLAVFNNVSFSYIQKPKLRDLLLFKKTKEFKVLSEVNFEINKGDVIGVIGCNGAGKSTTLLMLAGVLSPTKGSITKNYKNVALLNFNSGMLPVLSGADNIYLQGMFLGMTQKKIKESFNSVVELSGIGEAIYKPVKTYSTGMKSRLGFSIAYHRDPELMLIDETLGVGDRDFRLKSTVLMKEKIKNGQGATVLVSHNRSTIQELCTKCAVIENGTVVYFGPTAEAIEKYEV